MKPLFRSASYPDPLSAVGLSEAQRLVLLRKSCAGIADHSRRGILAFPLGTLLLGISGSLLALPLFWLLLASTAGSTLARYLWIRGFPTNFEPDPLTWTRRFGALLVTSATVFSLCGAWIIFRQGISESAFLAIAITLAMVSQAVIMYAHSRRVMNTYLLAIVGPYIVACFWTGGTGTLIAIGGLAFAVYCARSAQHLHLEHWQGLINDVRLRQRAEELQSARDSLAEVKDHLEEQVQERVAEVERIAEELRKREADYRLIFDSAHDAILIFDPAGERVLNANQRASELYGYPKEQLIGMSLLDISVDAERGNEQLEILIDSHQWVAFETQQRRSDGTVMDLEVRALTIEHQGRRAVLSLNRDITEVRRAEELRLAKEAAERASEAKGQLLANMSHELRTPMVSIIGLSELLLHAGRLAEEDRGRLEIIRGSGEMLLGIIDDILDFSRADVGKIELELRPFPLSDVTSGVIDMVRLSAESSGIELRHATAPGLPQSFLGDASRIRQILLNLLGNAVKFTEQGHVTLEVGRRNSGKSSGESSAGIPTKEPLRFRVSDSGPGIDPELQVDLFQPFTQADNTMSRRFGGSGLGLAICKRLAELMGGTVGFHSELGQGSVFWLDLDLQPVSQSPPRPRKSVTKTLDLKGLEILVTEDNPINQLVLSEQLEELGLKVFTASDGVDAVEQISSRFFPLVLMDCQMPEMDGYEATRRIRRLENQRADGRSTIIIATTAHAMAGDRERCLDAGMDAYLAKPFTLEQLAKTLSSALKTVPNRD